MMHSVRSEGDKAGFLGKNARRFKRTLHFACVLGAMLSPRLAPGAETPAQACVLIEKEGKVEVDRAEATEMVKGALKKAVKKAAAKIVEEAVAK